MPCYLFTYHAYGSWLPDHRKGYVRRRDGVMPPNHSLACTYRSQMKQSVVLFSECHQKVIVEGVQQAVRHLACQLHCVATDSSHVHVLVSWEGDISWFMKRNSIKTAITIALKYNFARRDWLSRGASRKQIRNRSHFEYLMQTYLPKHSGIIWSEQLKLE